MSAESSRSSSAPPTARTLLMMLDRELGARVFTPPATEEE
jgi:hypothetical protein